MKNFDSLIVLCFIILLAPILLVLVVLVLPFLVVGSMIQERRDAIELREWLKRSNGSIFFIYADYNNFDFSWIFQEKHPQVFCVKTNHRWENDLYIKHLTKGCLGKSFPRLVKIEDKNLISKEHYNSFKHYYRRKDDIDSFLGLIEASIQNLENDSIETIK